MSRSRLWVALLVAAISLLGYFGSSVFNPITEEKQHVAGITPEQEVALGLQAAPEMAQQFGGLDPDPEAQARVDRVGERLVSRSAAGKSPYRFEFHVLDDPETINAFALPGGQVFITEGLLRRLKTDGQLAGVLGHEIGHVVARHGAEHIAKQQLTEGLTGALEQSSAAGVLQHPPQSGESHPANSGGDSGALPRRSAGRSGAVGELRHHGRSDSR